MSQLECILILIIYHFVTLASLTRKSFYPSELNLTVDKPWSSPCLPSSPPTYVTQIVSRMMYSYIITYM